MTKKADDRRASIHIEDVVDGLARDLGVRHIRARVVLMRAATGVALLEIQAHDRINRARVLDLGRLPEYWTRDRTSQPFEIRVA